MNYRELRELAKYNGVSKNYPTKKAELVGALTNHEVRVPIPEEVRVRIKPKTSVRSRFNDRVFTTVKRDSKELFDVVFNSSLSGKTYDEVAKEVNEYFDVGFNSALEEARDFVPKLVETGYKGFSKTFRIYGKEVTEEHPN